MFFILIAILFLQDTVYPCSEVKVFKESSLTSRKVSVGVSVDTIGGVLTLYNYDTREKDHTWIYPNNCIRNFTMDGLRRLKYTVYKNGEEADVVLLFDEVRLHAAAISTKDGMVVYIIDRNRIKRG